MKGWEVEVARQLMKDVEGVPVFVSRVLDQLLLGRMKGTDQDEVREESVGTCSHFGSHGIYSF
jgi:hypothetical protein